MTTFKGMPALISCGGYRELKYSQTAESVHDATAVFCDRFIVIQPVRIIRTRNYEPMEKIFAEVIKSTLGL